MRNIYEVIRHKEAQIQEIQKELEALRVAARLLADDDKDEADAPVMRMAAAVPSSGRKPDSEVVLSAPHRPFP